MIQEIFYFLLGYFFFSLSSSDKTGDKNKFDKWLSELLNEEICTSLKVEFDTWEHRKIQIHLHHWLLLFIIFILSEDLNLSRLKFACLGGMAQGIINYTDWYQVIKIIPREE